MMQASTFSFYADIQVEHRIAIPKEFYEKHKLDKGDHCRIVVQVMK